MLPPEPFGPLNGIHALGFLAALIEAARYVATPIMSDGGEGPPLELRGLFEQFLLETR